MVKIMFSSVAAAKSLLRLSSPDYSADDPLVKESIVTASIQMSTYCRRDFTRKPITDYFKVPHRPSGIYKLFTSGVPIVEGSVVSSIVSQYSPAEEGVSTDLLTYHNSLSAGVFGFTYSDGFMADRYVKVSYTSGFDVVTEDSDEEYNVLDAGQDFINATALQTAFILNRMLANKVGKRDTDSRAIQAKATYTIIPEVAEILRPYVRPSFVFLS